MKYIRYIKYTRNITPVIIILSMLSILLLPKPACADQISGQISSAKTLEDSSKAAINSQIAGHSQISGNSQETGNSQTGNDPQTVDDIASTARLMIDNQNRYDGMNQSYSEGYIPTITNGNVYLVVPILCDGSLKDNCLRVSLNLGDAESAPFVLKNYEKSIYLTQSYVNSGAGTAQSYVAAFWLELKSERYNGGYPVTVSVIGEDTAGNEVSQEFSVYVTITDGTVKKDIDEPVEEPTPLPKVVISSCQFSKTDIQAGDEVTADITLTNTSKTEYANNLTAAISASVTELMLLDQSDTVYVESIPPQGTCVVSFRYQVNAAAPQGQYSLALAMDYTDSKSNTCSFEGTLNFPVSQPSQVQFDPLVIPADVEVADVVEASIQAMNLGRGKVYNVRAVIEADGLTPQGTIFIGDLEPGAMATGSTQVTVGSLSESGSPYGSTEGTVTFYYEDEAGTELTEAAVFQTTIQSPFSEETPEQEDHVMQWWIIMSVIAGALVIFAAITIMRKVRFGKQHEMVEKVLETQKTE